MIVLPSIPLSCRLCQLMLSNTNLSSITIIDVLNQPYSPIERVAYRTEFDRLGSRCRHDFLSLSNLGAPCEMENKSFGFKK